MKKENGVIDIAGLALDTRGHDRLLRLPIYDKFIYKSKKKNEGSSRLLVHGPRSTVHGKKIGKDTVFLLSNKWKNRRCSDFSLDGKFISYAYSQLLAANNGMLLHAAAVVKNKKAFIFFGKSGAGKSTIAGLSKRYKVLGDDIIAARKIGSRYYAFATPWSQSSFIKPARGQKCAIAAIFFIDKSDRISFKPLGRSAALARIVSNHIHFLIYTKKPLTGDVFVTAADFVKRIPAYGMKFSRTRDFWPALEEKTQC